MAASDDSRPFAVLKQNAEDFKAGFDEDITQCLAELDSKITDLLRDQESASSSFGEAKRLNAHMEFSKAKLGIFVTMKDLLNEMESSWIEQLSELKEAFVENVEIFLAGTKLEMKETPLPRSGSKKSLSYVKGRKGYQNSPSSTVSSLYPTLLSTAKHIPVINSLLPNTAEQEMDSDQQNVDSFQKSPGPNWKSIIVPAIKDTPEQIRKKNNVRFLDVETIEPHVVEDAEMEGDDDEIVVLQTPVQKRGRGRPSAAITPTSIKKAVAARALQNEVIEIEDADIAPVGTPVRPSRGSRKSVLNTPSSLKKPRALTPFKRNEKESSDSSNSSEDSQTVVAEPRTRRGSKALPSEPAVIVTLGRSKTTPAKRGRKAANQTAPEPELESETSESDSNKMTSAGPKTPKNVHFSLGLDLNEDLEIYSPQIDLSRSAPRRKTTLNPSLNTLPDLILTPDVIRTKSKRKTVGGDLRDLTVAPSPKRLKKSGSRSSLAPPTLVMEPNEANEPDLLDDDEASGKDNYTPWIPLSDVGAKVPTQPGIYELKVSQAKKPAFIGSCESLRQKLTLHKLKHTSGHKHLDKFVERNAVNILVRYEITASVADAKAEEKNRIKAFVSHFNTTPAYN